MPEIVFKGKEYVYNHHLGVPYRPLVPQADKGIGAVDLAGNLVVHGDNLHALKSLLPRYAGQVDLIFIDPPYNTGNEGWCYSDNVNSPIMREWLSANPVDGEDMLRHDKWLCMMWPRLVLLRELLSERGSIWITLDDNEVHRAKLALDEVFSEDSFVGMLAWQKRTSRENRAVLSPSIDHLLVYAKGNRDDWKSEAKGLVPDTLWFASEVGDTEGSKKSLMQMFPEQEELGLHAPKPVELLERIVQIATRSDSLVLDSFAGSGTTAHAVLKANAKDNGTRRFILVEGEAYADTLTAERVRRAIQGYAWQGTQRETLLEEKITFTQFKKAHEWLAKVDAIKRAEGLGDDDGAQATLAPDAPARRKRFDKIEVKIDEGMLRVEGVRRISDRAPGLGGSFTYCTLGEPVDLEKLLSGEHLPARDALGAWLFYTATGATLPAPPADAPAHYLGEALDKHVWLIYEPSLAYLKSPAAALTLSVAQSFQAWGRAHDGQRGRAPKGHLVFSPAKYLSNKQLKELGVDHAPLPFALYREA